MGNTYTNTSSGKQNIAIGKHAVAEQTINHAVPQGVPVEDLLKLLAEIKARLPELPAEAQAELRNEVEGAELQARKDKPDGKKIAAKLEAAKDVLTAIPGTVAAALPVSELIGKALIWCGKAVGM
jgi:hypothetical protein